MPGEAEIEARATELGYPAGTAMKGATRARIVQLLLEGQAPKAPQASAPVSESRGLLLSSQTVAVADGHLVIEVRHIAGDTPAE